MKKFLGIFSAVFFLLVAFASNASAAFGSGSYVEGTTTMGNSQYENFIALLNSPIGWIIGFVLGIRMLKWMGIEVGSMIPGGKK